MQYTNSLLLQDQEQLHCTCIATESRGSTGKTKAWVTNGAWQYRKQGFSAHDELGYVQAKENKALAYLLRCPRAMPLRASNLAKDCFCASGSAWPTRTTGCFDFIIAVDIHKPMVARLDVSVLAKPERRTVMLSIPLHNSSIYKIKIV